MTQRLPPPCRYVYVIGPEIGLQKIGIATDPRSRLAALQTASPTRLKIHASIAVPFGAAHGVERRAHNLLRTTRAAGEWFNVPPAEAVDAVRTAAGVAAVAAAQPAPLPLFDFAPVVEARSAQMPAETPTTRVGLARFWKVARMGLSVGKAV